MTDIDNYIFKGKVLDVLSSSSLKVSIYDTLSALSREHISSIDGHYYGMDAAAIFKNIIFKAGNTISLQGISVSSGVIIDEIDLTDLTILDAMLLLITTINGQLQDDVYQFYIKNGEMVIAPLPSFEGESILDLTDANIIAITKDVKGSEYYNCATVIGQDNIRGYYPSKVASNGDMMPDFPTDPRYHKLIKEYKDVLIGTATCNLLARGFVKSHNILLPEISVTFRPDRYDILPGYPISVYSEKYDVDGRYRVVDVEWSYAKEKSMTLTLSSLAKVNLADTVKAFIL